MKALVNKGDGGVAVEMAEVPEPEPGPGEAVVEVRAVAVNRGELRLLRARPRGWRPGQDVAGVVTTAAADGSGPDKGSRVVAWPEQAGWAERVAVPSSHLALLAPGVSFAEAATLPVAGVTALRTLRLGGDLKGRRVLITGAAGGVGRFAVELAAGAGASVIGVAADDSRAIGLDELGAADVVHDADQAEGPFDLILESAGGPSLESAVRLVAPGGTIVVFGNSSDTPASISFGDFRGRAGARIVSFFVYESGEPPTFGSDLRLLADMVAEGRLHPTVGLEASWADPNQVFEALAQRRVNGKAVLVVG
ncbi:MAG TPA: zinc-binding dehydrogenase [Acidimicrobiia bacterium]